MIFRISEGDTCPQDPHDKVRVPKNNHTGTDNDALEYVRAQLKPHKVLDVVEDALSFLNR